MSKKTLRNTRAFVRAYLKGKTGQWVLSRTYGRYANQRPKPIAHAFLAALEK